LSQDRIYASILVKNAPNVLGFEEVKNITLAKIRLDSWL